MGIAFTQIEPNDHPILEKWVEELRDHQEAGHGADSTPLVTGMLAPFNRAIREFNAKAKPIPRSWQTINHSSDLPKFSR
jgi:hypothetical protein